MSAGPDLQAAAVAELADVAELGGVYDGPPVQAVVPYATVETGPETDWGHKNGAGGRCGSSSPSATKASGRRGSGG